MYYVILCHDAPDGSSKRPVARPAHLEHLRQLQREGRLLLAGPRPKVDATDPGAAGYHGSLIVAEFPNLAAARAWAESDPYYLQGVFAQVDVWPFVKVLPA